MEVTGGEIDDNGEKMAGEVEDKFVLKDYASKHYEQAGDLVDEQDDEISLIKYSYLLSDRIAIIINEENPLKFDLQDFQKVALHALGSGQNVILISFHLRFHGIHR